MKKQIFTILLAFFAMLAGALPAKAFDQEECYQLVEDNLQVGNLTFDLWESRRKVHEYSNYSHQYYEIDKTFYIARLIAISGTEQEVKVLKTVNNGGQVYDVVAVGDITNNYVKTLIFQGNISFAYSEYWYGFSRIKDANGNAVFYSDYLLGSLSSTSLETLVFEGEVGLTHPASGPQHKHSLDKLKHIYFKKSAPYLEGNWSDYFSSPSRYVVTAHVNRSQALCDEMKASWAVWSSFKSIVPYYSDYRATVENNSGGEVEVYSCDELSYSAAVAENKASLLKAVAGNSATSIRFDTGKNYCVKFHYDHNLYNAPTVTRNGEPIALTTLEAGVAGYEETNVQEAITYVVTNNYKSCRLSFDRTVSGGSNSGYLAGTYKIVRNGQTLTGNITNGFVDCDYGTQVTLTFPATYELTNARLYNHTTQQSTPYPASAADGLYTITFDVPSAGSARFYYTWMIPNVVVADPVIRVMRMGEGEVKLTGFWDWSRDHDEYYNQKVMNCMMSNTEMAIPKPTYETDAWGFKLEMKPLKGQILRKLLVAQAVNGDDTPYIEWDSYAGEYDASTGTYTFLVDLYNGIGEMNFGQQDYTILVDMGPKQTIVEEGYKHQILCKGTTESQVWYSAEERQNLSTNGSTTIVMDDDDGYDHFIGIDLAEGETFTVYRDGVDVTNQFPHYNKSTFLFEFCSEDSYASSWTILFEKEEKNTTNWTVIQPNNDVISELLLTRGGSENETVACTEAMTTQTFDTDIQKVTLRVATTGESSEYSVYLVNYGSDKMPVIKAVKEITGLGLAESKNLVDSADGTTPVLVKAFATAAEAQAAKETLETAGATVQVSINGRGTRIFRDGVDVTAQGTADGNYLCFEVTADNLANTTWVITAEPVMPNPYDVNGDGVIDMQDAIKVMEKYMNQ